MKNLIEMLKPILLGWEVNGLIQTEMQGNYEYDSVMETYNTLKGQIDDINDLDDLRLHLIQTGTEVNDTDIIINILMNECKVLQN